VYGIEPQRQIKKQLVSTNAIKHEIVEISYTKHGPLREYGKNLFEPAPPPSRPPDFQPCASKFGDRKNRVICSR